jgi:ribokinase
MAGRIVVVGSLNADLVVRCARAPAAGETVAGTSFASVPGGKGANQAVAAARAAAGAVATARAAAGDGRAAAVALVGCVGRDDFGREMRASLRAAGVDDALVRDVDGPTGCGLIVVEESGQNRIVIVAGANGAVRAGDLPADAAGAGDHLILQLEVPFEEVVRIARAAAGRGATVHLNAAPADRRALELSRVVDHLIVNESEAALLVGVTARDTAADAGATVAALRRAGFARITLTLGAAGAIHCAGGRLRRAKAPRVAVVDTTAAGDAFIGAWVAAERAGAPVDERLRRAVAAGTLAVTVAGALPSLPAADAIERIAASIAVEDEGAAPSG